MTNLRRFLCRCLSFFRADRAETDLAREIKAHLRLLEDQFVAQGMTPEDARHAARRTFGGVEQVKERQRDARSFRWLDNSWLDLKLGFRMLVKYPGLTLVGGLGMSVAIAIGAVTFAAVYSGLHPTLPLDEGDRIVGLENWDSGWNNQEHRILHDFETWRHELKSIDVGAFRPITRNLIAPDGRTESVSGAEMTASGFRIARVAPLLGRPLVDADEQKGAPLVVVIGYDIWRTRFSSDPAAVGKSIRLGPTVHTVVGIMPQGFRFPVSHSWWVPLQWDPTDYPRRRGPEINVFGRLSPGVTLDEARAELATLGLQAAAAFPKTHARLRPRIVRYTELMFDDEPRSALHVVQLIVIMLLAVVCVNVSALMYARTVTREAEIAIRTALGASRGRIVGQLFVEALVLSIVAAAGGLALASFALHQADAAADLWGIRFGGIPFWMTFSLSSGTVVYALALAVLGAVIVGVLPAIKTTGRRVQSGLRHLGGATRLKLGTTWTALIVAQVALAVAVLPAAVFISSQSIRQTRLGPGFPADEFLTARLVMDWNTPSSGEGEVYDPAYSSQYAERLAELVRRIQAEPEVSDVTFSSAEPGDEGTASLEIERAPQQIVSGHARTLDVAVDFFEAFDVPIHIGRQFASADFDTEASAVVVNRIFAQQFFGDGNALGRRVRHPSRGEDGRSTRWYEIVGVVGNLPSNPIVPGETEARLYHPLRPGERYPVRLSMRLRSGALEMFGERLREIASRLDPTLRLSGMIALGDVYRREQMGLNWGAVALALLTSSVLLLSAAGIYALMSFTVSRRRREIGIRAALGADPRQILWSIFSRALVQLAIGLVAGVGMAALLDAAADGEMMGGNGLFILPLVSTIMVAVGLLAALGPARRGLRIHPTEALREE